MLIKELHTKKTQVNSIAKKYGGSELKIFDSVARGEEKANSDVDVYLWICV